MKMHPRCFARSRPSKVKHHSIDQSSPSIPHSKRDKGRSARGLSRSGEKGEDGIRHSVHGRARKCNSLSSPKLTVHPHLTLVLQIALVSDEDHRKVVLVLDPKDLLMELVDFLE